MQNQLLHRMPHSSGPVQFNLVDSASPSCPRILCLHGGGTNSQIFRIACRVLKAQLSDHARLVYADGPFHSPPGPLIDGVFRGWGPFRSWLPPDLGVGPRKGQGVESIYEDPTDSSLVIDKIHQSLIEAMESDDQAGMTGPWVGILGFSQGAKIAASLLLRQQNISQRPPLIPLFSFGILIAGTGPLVWLGSMESKPMLTKSSFEPVLGILTIHVYGSDDSLIPSSAAHLYHFCSPQSRKLLIWDGDHVMPTRSKDVLPIVEMVIEQLQRDLTFRSRISTRQNDW